MAKILVVDDDAVIREVAVEILKAAGHEVSVATNGAAALAEFRLTLPNLVITDLVMPGMGGLKLIAELQQIAPATRIVAISGGDASLGLNFLSAARTYGVETLNKPFRPKELLSVVQNALSRAG
ncbi:MAG: response regulator [Anaerolineaceae bacterium]|nr:response regulator [Anaerolineaceae bacterium]